MPTSAVRDVETDEESIVATFADLARELRLPQLDWEFLRANDEVIAEGRPHTTADLAACLRWARFLGMSPVLHDAAGNTSCWLGVNGPWTLEIFAEVR